jgi:uncharacterized protein YbjT (DUF2867 family)
VTVPPATLFIPTEGMKARGGFVILNHGENNLQAQDATAEWLHARTLDVLRWLATQAKRMIVAGHFVNPRTPAVSPIGDEILRSNALARDHFGSLYVDLLEYLTGPDVWTQGGLTSTADDQSQQTIGNAPLSLLPDGVHMGPEARAAWATDVLSPSLVPCRTER